MRTKKAARLRKLADRIIDHRAFVTFINDKPRYLFNDVHSIPWRYRRNPVWLHDHIVMPAIRERLHWDSYKLTGNALPISLRVDSKLW